MYVISYKKKSKEALNKSKPLFRYINSAPDLRNHQNSLNKKTITQSRFAQFFFIGVVYFRWYLVNPHVQAVQIM